MSIQATFGRYAEIPLSEMTPEQRDCYEAIMRDRGMCPGPYKIWVENPPLAHPAGRCQTGRSHTPGLEKDGRRVRG